jgi:hypothetical protein
MAVLPISNHTTVERLEHSADSVAPEGRAVNLREITTGSV